VALLGELCEKKLETLGSTTKKSNKASTEAYDALFGRGIPHEALFSPRDNSGKKLKEGADTTVFKLADGKEYGWIEIFDSVALSIATGYCTAAQLETWKMPVGEKLTSAFEQTRTEVTLMVQNVITSARNALKKREEDAEIDRLWEEAQAKSATPIPRSDFEKKKGANDTKLPRDAAGEHAINAIKRLQRDETPDKYDHAGAIAAFRLALVCLNVKDTTLEEESDK